MNRFERLAYSLPEPVRRALFRNRLVWRLRNKVTRTRVAEMAPPLEGCRMRLPREYLRSYGVTPVEPEAVTFIEKVVRPGWIVADVGAFAGYYSLFLAKLVGPEGAVHAFEPVPENFEMLEFNVRLNQCGEVRANRLAVGAADGEGAFHRFRGLYIPYGTLVSQPDTSRYAAIPTKVRALDSYLADLGWPSLSFVKIDVEAAEAQTVRGMRETIERFAPTLLIEIHDGPSHNRQEARKVLPLLIDAGYELFSLQDDPGLERPITRPDAWSGHKHCAAVHPSR